jgi:hypothetical protein
MLTPEDIQKQIEKKILIGMDGKNVRGLTTTDGEVDVMVRYDPEADKFIEIYRISVPNFDRRLIAWDLPR